MNIYAEGKMFVQVERRGKVFRIVMLTGTTLNITNR